MSNAEAFHAKRNFAAGVSNTDRLAIGEGMTDQEQHCLHQSNRNLFRSISSRISDRGVALPADCGPLQKDRQGVVSGKGGSLRLDIGCRVTITKKKTDT